MWLSTHSSMYLSKKIIVNELLRNLLMLSLLLALIVPLDVSVQLPSCLAAK